MVLNMLIDDLFPKPTPLLNKLTLGECFKGVGKVLFWPLFVLDKKLRMSYLYHRSRCGYFVVHPSPYSDEISRVVF